MIASAKSTINIPQSSIPNPPIQSAIPSRQSPFFRLLIAHRHPATIAAAIPTGSILSMAQETLPVVSGDKDRSLQDALTRLAASKAPLGAEADPIVTASHRLPAMAAS